MIELTQEHYSILFGKIQEQTNSSPACIGQCTGCMCACRCSCSGGKTLSEMED